MTQTMRQRRELHAVTAAAKPAEPGSYWLDPRWHDPLNPNGYKFAATHGTSDEFLQRQIKRGLVVKDKA